MEKGINWKIAAAVVICLAIALPALAQGPGGRFGQRAMAQSSSGKVNHLAGLERALQAAGAPALTSDQETSLSSLITGFVRPTPSSTTASARTTYNSAILAGDATGGGVIPTIASGMETNTSARLTAEASFGASVVNILGTGTGSAVDLLVKKFGTDRTVGLIMSLVGGPGAGFRMGAGSMQGQMLRRPSR